MISGDDVLDNTPQHRQLVVDGLLLVSACDQGRNLRVRALLHTHIPKTPTKWEGGIEKRKKKKGNYPCETILHPLSVFLFFLWGIHTSGHLSPIRKQFDHTHGARESYSLKSKSTATNELNIMYNTTLITYVSHAHHSLLQYILDIRMMSVMMWYI